MTGPPGQRSPTTLSNASRSNRLQRWVSQSWPATSAIAFWAIVAIQSLAWRFYLTQFSPKPVPLDFIVRAEILMFGLAALLTPGIAYAARRFPLDRELWAFSISTHIAAGVAFALVVKLLWDVAMLPFYYTPWIAHFSWGVFRR